MDAKEIWERERRALLNKYPDRAAFFRVEEYLWERMWEQAPNGELRAWYVDAWLELTCIVMVPTL